MLVSDPFSMWDVDSNGKKVIKADRNGSYYLSCGVACPECRLPFGVILKPNPQTSVASLYSQGGAASVDMALHGGAVATIPESPTSFEKNPHLPEKIREAFVYAQEDAARRRNPAGILSTARGCLDVALKELGESDGGRRERIDRLAGRGLITQGIAAWAQQLWAEGSDAVHDLDADIDRAVEHIKFLELFFEVAFTLPSKIQASSHGVIQSGSA